LIEEIIKLQKRIAELESKLKEANELIDGLMLELQTLEEYS
jgi:hypothetical protein